MPWRVHGAQEDAAVRELADFVYELLDAHDETSELAAGLADADRDWALHVRYLRDLHRAGRELLARTAAQEGGR